MEELRARRLRPFALAAAALAVLCVAVARLPDSLVVQLDRRSPFTSDQTGWAYRLLALAAIAQAVYGGFVLLRPARVERARQNDPKLARMPHTRLIAVVARTAASMVVFTVVYGLAAFAVSGQRGGFWLFPVIALAQGGWYYREVGQIGGWLAFQREQSGDDRPSALWVREPADYCPPIARGLVPVRKETAVLER